MKWKLATIVAILGFFSQTSAVAQCKIQNKLFPEGSLYYYTDPVLIYRTPERELLGNVVTDRELYFLVLLPRPFPEPKIGKKMKEDLEIKFDDNTHMTLEHFDSRYIQDDSVFVIMYQIPQDSLAKFTKIDISSLTTEAYHGTGIKNYNLVLHKNAISEQLICLLKKTAKKEDE